MSWITEHGEHEGYAALITRDGREAVGASGDGLLMDHEANGERLPWSELLGWEARCECTNAGRAGRYGTHVGPMFRLANTTVPAFDPYPTIPDETWLYADGATVEEHILAWWHAHIEASKA